MKVEWKQPSCGEVIGIGLITDWRLLMAGNPDEPRPTPFTERVEPLTLIIGMVAIPALAIALGIGITILANALR
jgi:hypothetical protein